MRTDCFTEEALISAYEQAASAAQSKFEQFAENSKFFDFAVTPLGAGLSMSVECDTSLPKSTPAELREKKFQQKLAASQKKANEILDRQRKIQEKAAKAATLQMKKLQRKSK
jgi:hypothetical protein